MATVKNLRVFLGFIYTLLAAQTQQLSVSLWGSHLFWCFISSLLLQVPTDFVSLYRSIMFSFPHCSCLIDIFE